MTRQTVVLTACLAFVATSFLLGINWGLPSKKADGYLFGDRKSWSGKELIELAARKRDSASGLGADVDRDPLSASGEPVFLNDTDQKRAEIVIRYRLYSYQPDEMITFMSLAQMKPRQLELDPKLYQYGGLWIYPIGGLLGVGSIFGLIDLKSDLAYYLDHPDAFARFYVAARLYSAAFGILGAWCVWWLVKRMSGSHWIGCCSAVAYCLLPVVNNMAHEAKPHLPGSVLMLLAVIAATKFVKSGRNWWVVAAIFCGAASGMIISAAPICMIVPIMLLLRPIAWRTRLFMLLCSGVISLDVYFATNPYVLKHLLALGDSANPLRSNLSNSKAMYSASFSIQLLKDAFNLLVAGATWGGMIAGCVGACITFARGRTSGNDGTQGDRPRAIALLLAVPAIIILTQFVALAAGKPGEYARFAMFPSIVLLVLGTHGVSQISTNAVARSCMLLALVGSIAPSGISYVWHFLLDANGRTTRTIVADRLKTMGGRGATVLDVYSEPAPYCLPPLDLWHWKIRLVKGSLLPDASDVSLRTVDHHAPPPNEESTNSTSRLKHNWIRARLLPTPISWAAKPFEVEANRRFVEPVETPDK